VFKSADEFKRTLCGGTWKWTSNYGAFHTLGDCTARYGCCAPGRFMKDPNNDQISLACSNCSVGLLGANENNDDTTCPGKCPAGKTSSAGTTIAVGCHDCEVGQYSATAGTACTNCVAGKTSSTGSKLISDCTGCEAGLYSIAGTACTTCPIGRAFVSSTECAVCGQGQYQDQNDVKSVSCQTCAVGRFVKDDGVEVSEHVSCKTCPKGYEIMGTDVTQCHMCTFSKVSSFINSDV
jgi:hypothetical protein